MLSLSDCHIYVNHNTYHGILKLSVMRDYHTFSIKMELFKILADNHDLVKIFVKNCEEDPGNSNICSLISNTLEYTETFNLKQIEDIVNSNYIDELKKDKLNYSKIFTGKIGELTLSLTFKNYLRLYYFFESLYKNYFILDAAYNIYMNQLNINENKKVLKNKQQIDGQENQDSNEIPKEQKNNTPKNINNISNTSNNNIESELDIIFSMALTQPIKSSAIHYAFSYYRFIDPKYCNVVHENSKIIINIPKILPYNYVFNEEYFVSIIESSFDNKVMTTEKIDYSIKKLLSLLITDNKKIISNSVYIMLINYLIFIYFLKYTSDIFPTDFKTKLSYYLGTPLAQTQMFNYFLKCIPSVAEYSKYVEFKINEIDDETFTDNIDTINKLSEEHKHLIPISQEKFADMIFNNIDTDQEKKIPNNFNLTHSRILDISYLKTIYRDNKQSVLYDSVNPEEEISNNVIDYMDNKTSKEYKYFKSYLENPSSIILLDDSELSSDIKLLFDIISNIVPELSKNDNDLLVLYNKIIDGLPHPEKINHNTILKSLYNIVVPYQYENNNINKFTDYFIS
ncbi:MAG: hypothetical protein ACOC2W_00480 [bacterium]